MIQTTWNFISLSLNNPDRRLPHETIGVPDPLYPFPLHPLRCCTGHRVKTESPTIKCSTSKKGWKVEGKQLPFKEEIQKWPTPLWLIFCWQKLIHTAATGYEGFGKCSLHLKSCVPSRNSQVLLLKKKENGYWGTIAFSTTDRVPWHVLKKY